MQYVGEYLITVIAAAIICAIAGVLIGKNTANNAMLKLLTGVFLSITVISPFTKIHFTDFSLFFSDIQNESEQFVQKGKDGAFDAMADIIKTRAETYVMNKAASMDIAVHAEIELAGVDTPYPISVKITGSVPPYKKSVLRALIKDELGIPEENQIWM